MSQRLWRNPDIRAHERGLIGRERTGMVGPRGFALNATHSAAPVVTLGAVKFGNDLPISIIAGPCQLERRSHALEVASALREIADRLKIGLV